MPKTSNLRSTIVYPKRRSQKLCFDLQSYESRKEPSLTQGSAGNPKRCILSLLEWMQEMGTSSELTTSWFVKPSDLAFFVNSFRLLQLRSHFRSKKTRKLWIHLVFEAGGHHNNIRIQDLPILEYQTALTELGRYGVIFDSNLVRHQSSIQVCGDRTANAYLTSCDIIHASNIHVVTASPNEESMQQITIAIDFESGSLVVLEIIRIIPLHAF